GRRHLSDVAHLAGQVAGHRVDGVRQVLPRAGDDTGHYGLATQSPFGADLTRDARHLGGERAQLLNHGVQGFLEQQNLTAHVHRNLLRQVAAGDGRRHFRDVAHLGSEVRGHEVDVIGEVLPRAGDTGHLRLAAKLAFRAHLTRDARHFAGKAVELIDHGVDGRLELENFALHIDGDALRQVATRNGRRHVGDVADLRGQVAGEQVDVVGQILPRAGDTRHVGLAAETAFGADLARHTRHLAGEAIELIDHRVQRFLQLKDLTAHVHRDLARKVAAGDGCRHLGDVAHLVGEVAGHRVDRVRQVLPRASDTGDLRLAAELAFGANLARHARHLGGEGIELIDHRVDGLFELQDFAADVDRHLFRQVAQGDGRRYLGDVAHLAGEVRRHGVDRVRQILPRAGDAAHHGLAA